MPEWGNKWWECDIKFQSKAQLKIIYNGNFEEPDGTRGYNRKGKSTMTVSKKKFLDDWEVLFYD